MNNPQILVVDSNNIDLITVIDRMPEEGETIDAIDFDIGIGEKGANSFLNPQDVEDKKEKLLKSDIILLQFEIPLETVYYTLSLAAKCLGLKLF